MNALHARACTITAHRLAYRHAWYLHAPAVNDLSNRENDTRGDLAKGHRAVVSEMSNSFHRFDNA